MRSGPCLVWLKDLFPRWMQSLLPSTVHDTKKHSSWFDLVRILIIPDAGETRGDNFASNAILCSRQFVVFSKLFDVYSKLSSSWISCCVPGVFFKFSSLSQRIFGSWSSWVNGWWTGLAKKWRPCPIRRDDESAQLGRNPHEQNCQAEPLLTVMSIQLLGLKSLTVMSGSMFWHLVPNRNSYQHGA